MWTEKLVGCHYIASDDNGRWFGARCGDVEIRIGDVITKAVRYKPRKRIKDLENPPEIIEERTVHLEVKRLQAYGKELKSVQGITCAVLFAGPDIRWLNQDWVLL